MWLRMPSSEHVWRPPHARVALGIKLKYHNQSHSNRREVTAAAAGTRGHRALRAFLIALLLLGTETAHAQWQIQTSPTKASLRGLSVVDSNTAWASGAGGTVLRTVDGGNTWTPLPVTGAESLDFRGIKAFDADHALIMSSGLADQGKARIYSTADAGKSWQQ